MINNTIKIPSLSVKNVTKFIDNGEKKIRIINNISFDLYPGTITALMGKSGCGKSTLLSVLCGIDSPSEGVVLMQGEDYYKKSTREQEQFRNNNIGILFQYFHLIPELTCEENIMMPLCFSRKKSESKVEKLITIGGLEEKRCLYPKQMSGGEQQRTALMRALVNSPKYLYADEPTGALDSKTGNLIIAFLLSCAHTLNMTILLATHDVEIANQCDNILYMADGEIDGEKR